MWNTALGTNALNQNSTGSANIAIGTWALQGPNTGSNNTVVGNDGLFFNTTGYQNVVVGNHTLRNNNTGYKNVAIGVEALYTSIQAYGNTGVGFRALNLNTTGCYNLALGFEAGRLLTTGSYNVVLAHPGVAGDNRTIRIGDSIDRTFIAGIRNKTVGNGAVTVVIDGDGRLGTVSSSLRYKQDVQDLGSRTERLYDLRPVSFRYKAQPDAEHFGLIAEEVAVVLPELVVRDKEGQIETVAYHELAPMLLNELKAQKLKHEAALKAVQSANAALKADFEALKAQVAQLLQNR